MASGQPNDGSRATKPSLPIRRPSVDPGLPSSVTPASLRSYSFRRRASGDGSHDPSRNEAEEKLLQSLDEADDVAAWLDQVVKQRLSTPGAAQKEDKLLQEEPGGNFTAEATPSASSSLLRLDRQLSSLSSSLGIARSDTSARIDATIAEVRSTIPRLSFDLRFVRDQAVACSKRLEEVRQQPGLRALYDEGSATNGRAITASPKSTADAPTPSDSPAAALSRLSALSTLRSRMTAARDVLRLAESWSTLSSDVLSYVSESKWALAASRLSEARSSLSVFERTPEYEGRRQLLGSLSDEVENAIVPLLSESLVKRDLANCKKLAEVFRSIGRAEMFGEHWRKSRSGALGASWSQGLQAAQLQDLGSAFGESFARLLAQLQTLLNEEILYATSLFPETPHAALAKLIEVSLVDLSPSLSEALGRASESKGREALSLVVRAHAAAKEAALGLRKVVGVERESGQPASTGSGEAVAVAVGGDGQASQPKSPEATRERRLSVSLKRQSRPASLLPPGTPSLSSTLEPIETSTPSRSASGHASFMTSPGMTPGGAADDLSTHLAQAEAWEAALFSPFVRFQCGYGALETQLLAALWSGESKTLGRKRAAATTTTTSTAMNPSPSSMVPPSASSLLSGDMARKLRDEVDLACALSEDAIGRALSLTWGLGAQGVITAIEELVTRLLGEAISALEADARQAADEARQAAADKMGASGASDLFGAGSAGANCADRDASSAAKEWKAFEAGVGLLRAAKQAWQRIEKLEESLALRLGPSAALVLRTRGRGPALEDAVSKLAGPKEARSALAVAIEGGLADEPRLRSTMETLEHLSGIAARHVGGASRETWRSTPTPMSISNSGQGEAPHGPRVRGLLVRSKASLLLHARSLQRHLCDIILAPLLPYFELYAALPAWEASRLPGAVNEYELAMPTFSLSPTETMSRVGEGMLDLPRLLEGWAEDEALIWAVGTLPFAEREEGEEEEQQQLPTSNAEPTEGGAPLARSASASSKRMSFHPDSSGATPTSPTSERRSSHRHSHSVAAIATSEPPSQLGGGGGGGFEGVSEEARSSYASRRRSDEVLQSHLRSISLVLLSHLTSLVLPSIPRLTSAGSAQLQADLDYLTNILSALNVDADLGEAGVGLGGWKTSLSVEEGRGRRLNREARMNQGRHLGEEDRGLIRRREFDLVSRMRGWKAG